MLCITIHVGMGSAKQRFHERLEMLRAIFQNRADAVREEIAAGLNGAGIRARAGVAWRGCRESPGPVARGGIALEVSFDSKPVIYVHGHPTSSPVQGETTDDVAILWIESHVGVVQRNFYFGVVLSERGRSKQQDNSQN